MKKGITILLSAVLLLGLTACGGNSQPTDAPAQDEDTAASEQKTLQLGETLKTDVVEFTLNSVEFVEKFEIDGTGYKPKDGNVYLAISYSVKNVDKVKLSALLEVKYSLALLYGEGYTFKPEHEPQFTLKADGTWSSAIPLPMEPLSPAVEIKSCISVPLEVCENTDEPAILEVNIPISRSPTAVYVSAYQYIIRP